MKAQISPRNKRQLGAQGEAEAADYLLAHGYEILHRNWRCKVGEIDLIGLDPDGVTCFVEVKQAFGLSHGSPASWVHPRKQRQLYRVAQAYLQQNGIHRIKCRFDVVTLLRRDGEQEIKHIKNAFIRM